MYRASAVCTSGEPRGLMRDGFSFVRQRSHRMNERLLPCHAITAGSSAAGTSWRASSTHSGLMLDSAKRSPSRKAIRSDFLSHGVGAGSEPFSVQSRRARYSTTPAAGHPT